MMHEPLKQQVAGWFRSLDAVDPDEMVGLWRGAGHPSGHPLDGVLENLHWFGKRFHANLRADALLFEGDPGKLVAVDPVFFPIKWVIKLAGIGRTAMARNLFTHIRHRVRAKATTAVLEMRMDDGVMTAAMVYDRQPIVDYLRKTGDGTIIGKMVVEGDQRLYFFTLEKADRLQKL